MSTENEAGEAGKPAQEATKQETKQEVVKQPEIDTEAIARKVSDEAKQLAEQKIKKVFKQLSGEEEKPEINPVLLAFSKDPEGTLAAAADAGAQKAVQILEERKQQDQKAQAIARPYLEQYPELRDNLDVANAFYRAELANGKDTEAAIDSAFKTTIKKLNLRSLTDEERQRSILHAGVPPVGAPGMVSKEQKASSDMDYVKRLRTHAKSVRGQLPPQK